ncbi:MAG TPA: phosphomannomutase/phosphoglucomutase [Candidatus Ratteibacteria bacterium]|mgnify:FL=1|uniref:Phosphomannomutase/phosphoglucomutase n=1 Tax=candidate division TA06 bacterium ADurb.Bin131 TaxID=1852827 RepID=A0A1V6CE89_UNCT6|nr:MAG: Phosphomannomutase/phosphoglucomutase [candidate division TA06 bacterium ADurb.Bin131]HON05933.1 phosphomannomutase/phosphoglucomutase [bacterium]HRS06519.1 phosphomannomutase/phosphoglucomutase [Candidatus Ratteibacteria bacterium]HPC28893.1 phosphomannomutase/phosphoglucomutase [bacterium]HQL64952.1 phosphomannomutase/phosphoglucomutase [bacterium]
MSIFKACDIRGKYKIELDEGISLNIGKAIGTLMNQKTIVVGGDYRQSTGTLKSALIDGIVWTGCNVIDIGIVPTPVFYFAIGFLSADGGVQITGSHNPPDDNGMKIVTGKIPVSPQDIQEIKQIIDKGLFLQGKGSISCVDVVDDYKKYIKKFFKGGNLKIVVDAGNGCFWQIAPQVLRELGYNVVELFCKPDGSFPDRSPNPAVYENLKKLRETVVLSKADFGVAYDGDGDRAIFVDEKGNVVSSDVAIVLYVRYILKKNPSAPVVYDIKCSQIVKDAIESEGGIPIMEKSGHAFIKTTFLKKNAIFAGEASGHYFFREICGDDGLFATLKMAEIVQNIGAISYQTQGISMYATSPDIRMSIKNGDEILERIRKHYPPRMITLLDGVRIEFDDGWALIRKSVTEPLITMRFEAKDKNRLEEIKNEIFSLIPEIGKENEK